ncbi:MAG: GxxExxY protein [Prosthecobacter sp.]|uniref:GxxExxY protein n=1 Tax=Prosthecobacter sp. TaxID=1965333 RepID=UPI0038FE3843
MRQPTPSNANANGKKLLRRRLQPPNKAEIGIASQRQVPLPLSYKGTRLDCGYRIDLLVENCLPLELKVVAQILGIHEAQLMTYLRIGRFPLGLLINFQVAVLKQGIIRKTETRIWNPPADTSNLTVGRDELTGSVIQAAIEVHRHIGPGILPGAYLACLCHELSQHNMPFEKELKIPLLCDGEPLSCETEVPLLIHRELPVFPVSADSITPVQTATAISRLRQGGWKRGLILNFNTSTMAAGIKRVSL